MQQQDQIVDPPTLPAGTLRVVPLGGLGEVGRNMTVFEFGGKLLIVDAGVLFPDPDQPGVDLILPDFTPVRDRLDDVLPDADRTWLLAEITDTRARLAALDWPLGTGFIHGDAWAGNLLWDTDAGARRCLLGDWDGLSRGPREIDLIPTWHAATRYGRGPAWAEAFTAAYGYDLAGWDGYPLLSRMRDLVQLTGPLRRTRPGTVFEDVLRQRLAGIRARDTSTWTAL